jgi:hypothetical protein
VTKSLAVIRVTAILMGGAIALWVAVGVTLNFTVARQTPAFVEAWWPAGSMAKVAEGRQQLTSLSKLPKAAGDRMIAKLRDAALRDPTDTNALSTLAAFEENRTGANRARQLFRASEAVSRRNTLTEMWLIEDGVRRGEIDDVIKHYNRAMLVSNDARALIIPVLGKASSNPVILKELLPVLTRRPLWWKEYILELGKSGDSAATMVAVLRVTRPDMRNPEEASLAQLVLRRMVALKAASAAVRAANRLEGLSGPVRSLRDGGFEEPGNALPFAWWLRDEVSIRAYRDTVPTGSTGLRLSTSSGSGGGVAQQLIGLRPGHYGLRGQAGGISNDRTARPAITIACETGKSLIRAELPQSDDKGQGFRFTFDVPKTGCSLQWVTIVTAPAVDTDAWLDNLAIVS